MALQKIDRNPTLQPLYDRDTLRDALPPIEPPAPWEDDLAREPSEIDGLVRTDNTDPVIDSRPLAETARGLGSIELKRATLGIPEGEQEHNAVTSPPATGATGETPEQTKLVVAAKADKPDERDQITARIPDDPKPAPNDRPDEMPADTENIQPPTQHLEFIRSKDGNRVTIVNRAHPDQEGADAAVSKLAEDIPSTWVRVEPLEPSGSKGYYQDPDSRFFAKVGPGPLTGKVRIERIEADASLTAEDKAELKELAEGRYSPEREMRLAPEIRQLLGSDEAQEVAEAHGFAGISYVEPYAAFVDTEADQKIVVYDMREGHISYSRTEAVSNALIEFFERHGMKPYDMAPGHLLIKIDAERSEHLNAIDTELFARAHNPGTLDANPGNENPGTEGNRYPENPSLEPGSVFRFDIDVDELREGPDPAYSDPERPEVAYAQAGSFVVGRRGEAEGPVFNAASEGCRVIAISNEQTGEAALVHIGAEDFGTEHGEELIERLLSAYPSLRNPATLARIFGDVETSPLGEDAGEWNERLAEFLADQGITVADTVSQGRGKDVYLSVATGQAEVFDATGLRLYPPEGNPSASQPEQPDQSQQWPERPSEGYEFHLGPLVSYEDIGPYGQRQLEEVSSRARLIEGEYLRQTRLARNKDGTLKPGSHSPQDSAELLDSFFSNGKDGLHELIYMFRNHTFPLREVSSSEDDTLVRGLLDRRLASAIEEEEVLIRRFSEYTLERSQIHQDRKNLLEDIRNRLFAPRTYGPDRS